MDSLTESCVLSSPLVAVAGSFWWLCFGPWLCLAPVVKSHRDEGKGEVGRSVSSNGS